MVFRVVSVDGCVLMVLEWEGDIEKMKCVWCCGDCDEWNLRVFGWRVWMFYCVVLVEEGGYLGYGDVVLGDNGLYKEEWCWLRCDWVDLVVEGVFWFCDVCGCELWNDGLERVYEGGIGYVVVC